MRTFVIVLACLACTSPGRRVQASSLSTQGNAKGRHQTIPQADAKDQVANTPKALAELLLASTNPAAAWQIVGHSRNLMRNSASVDSVGWRPLHMLQRLAVDISMQKTEEAVAPPGKFDFLSMEKKWQEHWDKEDIFKTERRPGKPKKYVLDMFPYPSGAGLHVGHPEGYTATDIMSRYWRMKDFDVLHPMGWDAFGLPAEQHAINTGTHPSKTTYENIANFKRQLKSLGFSYDWSRELATTDDDYVRWTQWIFLQLVKKGLAAQSEVNVNWCPALGTVLANEEIIDGLSERGNHPVKRMPLRQWVLKITEYADRLQEDLQGLDWPEGTLKEQNDWIGKSTGASIKFEVEGQDEQIEVFTTRPDTLFGVSYVVLAPENPLVSKFTTADQKASVDAYLEKVAGKSDLERTSTGKDRGKTGVPTGSFAVHPLTGDKLPVWVADYVLASYGTGAVMAVPAHDERDFAFADKFGLPIKRVVTTEGEGEPDLPFTELGVSCGCDEMNENLNGLPTEDMRIAVIALLRMKQMGSFQVNYKLRDWVFSRQRYWGEPIPIYFPVEIEDGLDPRKGDEHRICFEEPITVPEEELPVKLPPMDDFKPGDDPQGCLARAVDWRYFQKDGRWFARETNTMPQWAGSCWYYLRFTDPSFTDGALSKEGASWLPVDLYVGGQEHAVLHLLYARFWHKVLYDCGVVDHTEPFTKLMHQGIILGTDGEKMSKSRGNVINPDDVVNEHGADSLRLYEMFMGPIEQSKPWQTAQITGVVKFRDRVHRLASGSVSDAPPEGELLKLMHKTIKQVTEDVEKLSFNTAISAMMVFSTELGKVDGEGPPKECLETLMLLCSPFAPHVAEEGWSLLGHAESLAKHPWPIYKEELCVDDTVTLAVQVMGKVRGTIEISPDSEQAEALALAVADENVAKFLDGKKAVGDFKKVIYVKGRIINLIP
mmetsp:Transcript_50528/g.93443  ORF Transcript_50528/g.93443 Transcript_50528/m.93443 type:complete len:940 (-) Transcript_50528:52-2871(-)